MRSTQLKAVAICALALLCAGSFLTANAAVVDLAFFNADSRHTAAPTSGNVNGDPVLARSTVIASSQVASSQNMFDEHFTESFARQHMHVTPIAPDKSGGLHPATLLLLIGGLLALRRWPCRRQSPPPKR